MARRAHRDRAHRARTGERLPEPARGAGGFRRSGVRIAVDDAGAGFASLRHILELAPDIIKLDISIVRNIDTESSQRALASALVAFAREIGTELVAEGVETAGEAVALDLLGVRLIQGYYVARPTPLSELVLPIAPVDQPVLTSDRFFGMSRMLGEER